MQQCRLARSCPGAAGPPGRDTTALSRPVTSVRRAVTRGTAVRGGFASSLSIGSCRSDGPGSVCPLGRLGTRFVAINVRAIPGQFLPHRLEPHDQCTVV